MQRIKKNDTVLITSGKDKGKRGTVIEICLKEDKLIVKDAGLAVKHYKARRQGEASTIKRQESRISLSNVMPVCSACNTPCRVNVMVVDGSKVRACNQCKEIMR